jgi:flagellar hook assembly protein FlgD
VDGSDAAGTEPPAVHADPNPSTGAVTIRYRLSEAPPVTVEIFDTGGRLVRSLASVSHAAGDQLLKWDGRNESGKEVPGGLYLIRVERSNRAVSTATVIRVR